MKWLRRILLGLFVLLIVVGAGLFYIYNDWTRGVLPQHSGEISVAGLREQVEILRDAGGVPHIYASNLYDLLFAQGFTHAQDRWWQMEFFRRIGRGEIQELTGQNRSVMGQDVFIRTASWRHAAEQDLANLDADTLANLQAFADGVNAYIGNRPASDLALEYNLLGVTGVNIPLKPWEPLDTLVWAKVMAWDLGGNMDAEQILPALQEAVTPAMYDLYAMGFPFGSDKPTIIQLEDLAQMQERGQLPASAALPTSAPNSASAPVNTRAEGFAGNFDIRRGMAFAKGADIGSNNWTVHGDKTASGKPLLADDPHLGIQMPSIWYEIGLHCQPVSEACPINARGLTFATNPGVVIGHNDQIAWGVTNVGWDTQDLFEIEINPENELQYRWNGEWRDITVREEIIRYGDSSETTTLQVRMTHLGPIINDNRLDENGVPTGFNNSNPQVLRWTAYEPSTLMRSIFKLNTAQNFEQFREALRDWDAPAQNFVYADVDGNIGYQTPSNVPVRAEGHTGQVPVQVNSDEQDWRGYIPFENLPTVLNPERGYVATANQALVPLEYFDLIKTQLIDTFGADSNYVFGVQWAAGYRGQRIVEMLEASDAHDVQTFRAIHGDNKFILAEEIAPALAQIDMGDATLNELRDWMLEWDYQMHMDSAPAALFGVFWQELVTATFDDQMPEGEEGNNSGQGMLVIRELMNDPENAWWDDSKTPLETEGRDATVARAFKLAVERIQTALGTDRAKWRWGALHTATFVSNPLGLSGISLIEDMVNRGPFETSGGSEIVNATGWRDDLTLSSVPSMRIIVDLSDFDKSLIIHTTGQSGHPFSPQYADMTDEWRNIEYRPMRFSRAAVEAALKDRLVLKPQ